MSKVQGHCEICGTEIELQGCCSGFECGCMGQPVEPPVCSEKCYNTFFSKEYNDEKKSKQSICSINL